jgi:hypothetical protein
MKYAVYVIVIEDSEEADMGLAEIGAANIERVKGAMTDEEAIEFARDLAAA